MVALFRGGAASALLNQELDASSVELGEKEHVEESDSENVEKGIGHVELLTENKFNLEGEDNVDVGPNAVCEFLCKVGRPESRPGYKPATNGCGSYGVNVDFMNCSYLNTCCAYHDICYGICTVGHDQCDSMFWFCTQSPPFMEGFDVTAQQICKLTGQAIYGIAKAAGCPAFKSAQDKACICK